MKFSPVIFLITFAIVALSSCSDYNQVIKSDDYQRKIDLANKYYEEGSGKRADGTQGEPKVSTLLRCVALYEQIYQRMPKNGEGELAYFRIGKAYYMAGDYYMAGYYLGMFPQRFAFSPKGEESLFLSAMCSVNTSPESSLDQTDTELAIRDLQLFIDQYPQSSLLDSCNNMIDMLRGKLELKALNSVRLYAKTEQYQAAVSSSMTFMEDYPLSESREEVSYILVHNSYLFAINSIEEKKVDRIKQTKERYNTFVIQFPDSDYMRILRKDMDNLNIVE